MPRQTDKTCPHMNCGCHSAYRQGCRCKDCVAYQQSYNKTSHKNHTKKVGEMRKTYLDGTDTLPYLRKRVNTLKHNSKKNGWAFDISIEDVENALQKTCCECCGTYIEDVTERHMDHDHVTGKLRGMLCAKCNKAEGLLGGLERARLLVKFLEKHND